MQKSKIKETAKAAKKAAAPTGQMVGKSAAPAGNPRTTPVPRPNSKTAVLIEQLRQKQGATLAQLAKATGWQAHSVRGALSGTLKKKLGLKVTSDKGDSGRIYRIGR